MSPEKQRTLPGCGQKETIEEGSEVHCIAGFADGGRGTSHGMQVASRDGKGKEMDSGASRKECNPTGTLVLAQ